MPRAPRSLPLARILLALALLAGPMLAAGCVKPEPDPDRVVGGRVDGAFATNTYYKLNLVNDTGYRFLANFDRRDWYVTGIEREIAHADVEYATVQGRDRELINEVIAQTVLAPDDLNAYRYDRMEAQSRAEGRPFDKGALDAEWDARLAELAEAAADGGIEAGPDEGFVVPVEHVGAPRSDDAAPDLEREVR